MSGTAIPERTLMGPGPSDVHPRVLAALAQPTIGHLDPAFASLMEEIKALLKYAFRTENEMTIPVSAPGSAGMETCFVNLVEAGDKVVVCKNGAFGGRMEENVVRCGGEAIAVEDAWGTAVDPGKVADALKANPDAKFVAFVHAETSTGVQSDVKALCDIAHEHDSLAIVDSVTALGGIPVEVDAWGVDAIYAGTQKCLSCPPGLSPVSFNDRAMEVVTGRDSKVQSWFLDLNLVTGYWDDTGGRVYHHTAPVNAMYGLHEALVMLKEEGLENAIERHAAMHGALKAGLEAMGLSLIVDEAVRLPQLNAVSVPEGVDEAEVRRTLLGRYNLEIGAGLGALAGKIWRVGLMGQSASINNVILCLAALEETLSAMQAPVETGVAIAAAQEALG